MFCGNPGYTRSAHSEGMGRAVSPLPGAQGDGTGLDVGRFQAHSGRRRRVERSCRGGVSPRPCPYASRGLPPPRPRGRMGAQPGRRERQALHEGKGAPEARRCADIPNLLAGGLRCFDDPGPPLPTNSNDLLDIGCHSTAHALLTLAMPSWADAALQSFLSGSGEAEHSDWPGAWLDEGLGARAGRAEGRGRGLEDWSIRATTRFQAPGAASPVALTTPAVAMCASTWSSGPKSSRRVPRRSSTRSSPNATRSASAVSWARSISPL